MKSGIDFFNCLILAALGLCCCVRVCPVAMSGGLLIAVASLVTESGLEGAWASLVVVHGISCPEACRTFLDQR